MTVSGEEDSELRIVNARLRRPTAARLGLGSPSGDALADITIRGGRYAAIEAAASDAACVRRPAPSAGASSSGEPSPAAPPDPAPLVIDAGGALVTESFVNGHLHLCKVNTLELVGDEALAAYHGSDMGGAMTAIEVAAAVKTHYRADLLLPGIRRALDRAVDFGTTHIRAFADTDTTAHQEGIRAVMQARDEYADRVTVEAVAFPQDGVIRDDGAEAEVRAALEAGADVVGGIPWIELTPDAMTTHIVKMMDLADEFDRDVSMLVDDAGDAGLRTLEALASETIRRGRIGRVTAQHARAMMLYPEPSFLRLVALLKEARIGVVSDPHTGPLHARVRDLRAHGVAVGLGQDDIADAYYPFGRNNMLEVGFLAAHLLWMTGADDLESIVDMISTDAARVLGMDDFEIAPGNEANLLVHHQTTVRELLAEHEAPRVVVKAGRVIRPAERGRD